MCWVVHLSPRRGARSRGVFLKSGSGALPHDEQTALFIREAAIGADRPKEGDSCGQTGRPYDCSVGALGKTAQTLRFLEELPAELKAQRQANFEALKSAQPQGKA